MKTKTYLRYSESFKQEVVRHIQQTGEGLEKARLRLGIGGKQTIPRWIKKYGDPRLMSTKIVVMKVNEKTQQEQQAARIKELEKALVNLQLKHLEAEAFLAVACDRLGEDRESFKKKVEEQDLKKQ